MNGTMSLLRLQAGGCNMRTGCWDPSLKAVLEEPALWDFGIVHGAVKTVLVHRVYEVHPSSPDDRIQLWN